MHDQTHRTAIVTGASRGIGAQIARRLARDGFRVVVNYSRSAEAAAAVVGDIEAAGGLALACAADVGDPAAAKALFDAAGEHFGGVDVLVNNAGVMTLSTVGETTDAVFERTVESNLRGTFNMLREAAGRLREGGRIVNTSSTVTRLCQPGYGIYAATKAAVEALTLVMAREMRGRGITVNAVAPGPTGTELFLNGKSEAQVDTLARLSPLERLGRPEDIAAAVALLAGPDGGWINGQTVFVNGGVA